MVRAARARDGHVVNTYGFTMISLASLRLCRTRLGPTAYPRYPRLAIPPCDQLELRATPRLDPLVNRGRTAATRVRFNEDKDKGLRCCRTLCAGRLALGACCTFPFVGQSRWCVTVLHTSKAYINPVKHALEAIKPRVDVLPKRQERGEQVAGSRSSSRSFSRRSSRLWQQM